RWLAALGFDEPEETAVTSFVGYASRLYARPAGAPQDWRLLGISATPPAGRRGAYLVPLEGNRWLVTVAGAGGDYPPTDEAGFLDFLRGLPSPLLYQTIRKAQPLSPLSGYRRTENRRRHYERLRRHPEGFVVLGDAACAFNPVYGQGMTVAALGATLLGDCLREQPPGPAGSGPDLTGLAGRFQRRLARRTGTAWLMATGEDLRYPTTRGGTQSRAERLFTRYLDRVLAASTLSAPVHGAFLEVVHLLRPPVSLLRPDVVARVLLALLAVRHGSARRTVERPGATQDGPGRGRLPAPQHP
ncbi:MAG TPA: 2-polyprenyl-6-methoxyphenol hydroxylase-like oxidoreductase, partial [Chloroflexota bacterium]|nr:2-polyprenyl-6-methoxyphenol hydroxylase-like oxidoreductase [Chloroflexota bacterium]